MQVPFRSPIQVEFLHEMELSKLIDDAFEQAYKNQCQRELLLWEKRKNPQPNDPQH